MEERPRFCYNKTNYKFTLLNDLLRANQNFVLFNGVIRIQSQITRINNKFTNWFRYLFLFENLGCQIKSDFWNLITENRKKERCRSGRTGHPAKVLFAFSGPRVRIPPSPQWTKWMRKRVDSNGKRAKNGSFSSWRALRTVGSQKVLSLPLRQGNVKFRISNKL